MKTFTCSQERWHNVIENLLQLAQGNLSKKLVINYLNDDFESLEALLNIVTDEWKHRVLQMTFTKPTEAQRFINHFQILLDHDLKVQQSDQLFLRFINIDSDLLYKKKITDFIKPTEHKGLERYIEYVNTPQATSFETPSLTLFNTPFLYSVKKMASGTYILNLFQIQLDAKHFRNDITSESGTMIKLEQKKRYRDIVMDIKTHIDQLPLSSELNLSKLSKDFGTNIVHLHNGFMELYQCTPYDYFLTLKMKHAYLLIETDTISLKEISQSMGYAHYQTFSTKFFEIYNVRPRELRKKSRAAYYSTNDEETE